MIESYVGFKLIDKERKEIVHGNLYNSVITRRVEALEIGMGCLIKTSTITTGLDKQISSSSESTTFVENCFPKPVDVDGEILYYLVRKN